MNDSAPRRFQIGRIATAGHALAFVLRAILVGGLLSLSFAGLKILYDAERAAHNKIQISDGAVWFALQFSLGMFYPMTCIAVLVECTLPLLLHFRVAWSACQWTTPLVWSFAGAGLVWRIFSLEEATLFSKTVMLLAGGATLFFLSISLQTSLWQTMVIPREPAADFPFTWYAILAMLLATFFGGHRGWTDISPIVNRVCEYRRRQWGEAARPPAPGREVLEEWVH